MKDLSSALYAGTIVHQRLRPRRHRLLYRAFYLLLDLDEIETVAARLRLFSLGKFGLVSFRESDHGDGSSTPLRLQVKRHLQAAGLDIGNGSICLLTLPRILGYAFNPISVYYCHHESGALAAILYEVNNTFGDRHSYLIRVDDFSAGVVHQQSRKSLHVSPFLPCDMDYAFRLTPPKGDLTLAVTARDALGAVMVATLAAKRQTLSDSALLHACLRYPLVTMKIILAIHWEALKIWLKGVRFHRRPSPPTEPITMGQPRKRRVIPHDGSSHSVAAE